MKYAWTTRELAILQTTARVSSVFSLLGAGWIILTFSVSPAFHKPINRLAFFAAFGNILTNVATLISRDGIRSYQEGDRSLCTMQAVFIQWFMPADALFCAAMALNVYLTVFKKYSSNRLQKLEIPYIVTCYGIPLILAIVFIFISKTEHEKKYPIYGNATLWCWISDEWRALRLAAFYGPVWVVVIFTFGVYILAGKVIFELRHSLRGFARDSSTTGTINTSTTGTLTKPGSVHIPPRQTNGRVSLISDPLRSPVGLVQPAVSSGSTGSGPNSQSPGSVASTTVPMLSDPSPVAGHGHGRSMSNIPPSQSYLYSGYSCTVESTGRPISTISKTITAQIANQRNRIAMEANTAAWAYCRCAMLFFLALVVTWLPSSVNRIYTVIYPGATNFSLQFASALVLPCQGLWNGLIYTVTTLPACKEFFYTLDDEVRKLVGKKPVGRRRRREYRRKKVRDGNFGGDEADLKRVEEGPVAKGGSGRMGRGESGMGGHLGLERSSLDSVVQMERGR